MEHYRKLKLLGLLPRLLRRALMKRRYQAELTSIGEPELAELSKLVGPGDLAIDVGSNLGSYSYQLARLTGRVIAFEANPALAAFLSGLRWKGLEVRQFALSRTDGQAEFSVPTAAFGGPGWGTLRNDHDKDWQGDKFTVETRRLDTLELPTVALIKIDVEGAEQDVLEGAQQTLERDKPLLLIEAEERHAAGTVAAVTDFLRQRGYDGWFMQGKKWRPISDFDPAIFQVVDNVTVDSKPPGEKRYINNFLFIPAGKRIAGINY